MRLRHKIGAAMAAVTLTGLLTTGVFTALRVSRLFRAESDKRLMEATTSLAAEWRAMADRANVSVGDAAQSAILPCRRVRRAAIVGSSRVPLVAA